MPLLFQTEIPFISTKTNLTCLFFIYLFVGCYIFCISYLIYTLIRLFKYYLRQRQIHTITNEIINQSSATTILLQIHNIGEFDVLQPLIVQTDDLPPMYIDNYHNQSPPNYKEHV